MEEGTIMCETGKDTALVFLYEALGSACLVFAWNYDLGFIPFVLMGTLIIFAKVCGGHFNPAVTLGVFFYRSKFGQDMKAFFVMIIGQIVGGYFATLWVYLILSDVYNTEKTLGIKHKANFFRPGLNYSDWKDEPGPHVMAAGSKNSF